VPVVVGLALVLGCTTAFATPAIQALLPSLVRREDVGAAVAMNSVTFNLARAVGPAAGALIVARLGVASAFAINSLSYAALIGALLVVRPAPQGPPPSGGPPRLRDSLRLLRDAPLLAVLLGVVAAVSITVDPVTTLAPAFATRVFGRPDTVAGYLVSAFGAGAVAASFLPARAPDRANLAAGLRSIRAPLAVLVAGGVGFALAPTLAVALGALAVAGGGFLTAQTRATALLQLGVSDGERGRVMALWSVAFLGSRPIASLADGALATLAGPRAAALALCLPAAAALVLLTARTRRKRERGSA
jgi:predicted MFS family arabinose efflux permease